MKIDRKKIINRCGYDQVECMLLAKRLSDCPDEALISELKQINVWNYGKCELGLWADVLDRLDAILEHAVTRIGRWTLRLDMPGNSSLVDEVVTILGFTGHLIEHSIYRYLYGSWNHILALFGSENMDILLAVLGLSYNFSKRSNYFVRLDSFNKKMVLDRLVSIAETWGGSENNFGLAACCDPDHFPETAGNVYFEFRPEPEKLSADTTADPPDSSELLHDLGDRKSQRNDRIWPANEKIILHALHRRNQSPSQIMEELLAQHAVPSSRQMALFARVRLATYFSNPIQRHKCIRARLQALSILSYTFEVDERHLYPSLLDELVEVLELPEGHYTGIKACALRTMTAIVNSHRLGVNWASLVGSTGLSSYHGVLPNLTRRWVQGLVDGSVEAPGGSTNQQFTTALLSFLYHLACYEENVGPGSAQSTTLNTSGVLDTMLQLISWHTSRNDYLSYVTRAVRVTDQILMTISTSRLNVVTILVERLKFEVDLVLNTSAETKISPDLPVTMNTQRCGLMKSILNLIKRLCLDMEWSEVIHSAMDGTLPDILRRIFLNGSSHFTPHLALFAMESITNYLYTYPSRISAMQDKSVTADILTALTSQPLPQNRDFLVQLPGLFNTLALNARGIEAIQASGVLNMYLGTLISPEYLPTMKTKRVRDFLSQISYNLSSNTGQSLSNSLTANQMSAAVQELLRSHSELKPVVFQSLVSCLRRVVELGSVQPAVLVTDCIVPSELRSSGYSHPSSGHLERSLDANVSDLSPAALGHSPGFSRTNVGCVGISHPGTNLAEDVTALSADEEEGLNEDPETVDSSSSAQTINHRSRRSARILDSRSTSPTDRLMFKEGALQSSNDRPINLHSSVTTSPHLFLPDFMLNTCKFLEKLLPSVLHVTEAMCRHFVSHGGLQVLCDLLRMPGLPYDFPVSAACASLCKIFEDLANSIYLSDAVEPLFQCLDASFEKLGALQNSDFAMSSILLREYMDNEHTLLHELVVVASIICILVQIIDHLKPELRPSLANKWISRNLLRTLGRLYLSISWEAGILLKLLFGDKDITEVEIGGSPKRNKKQRGKDKQSQKTFDNEFTAWTPVTDTSSMPQFVEALHLYALLKPSRIHSLDNRNAFLHQRPDLVKVTHRILHVAAFFVNSFTELCTAWGRFFINRAHTGYRRRRSTLLSSDQISSATKYAALSQISQVLSSLLVWEPSVSSQQHPAAPCLVYAMRYAAIRLTGALLYDPSQKGPQSGMMNAFFIGKGIQNFFWLFRELISFDLTDAAVKGPLAEVLEEWLVCANRIGSVDHRNNTDANRMNEQDVPVIEPDKYLNCVYQNMLFPLEQLCTRNDLQNLLTKRAVEHLLSMLITIVPYLFHPNDKSTTSQPKEPVTVESFSTESNSGLYNPATADAPSLRVTNAETSSEVSGPQPMDTSESDRSEAESDPRTAAALQTMEEMGFSRELATIALEQTAWNTNEAVNLVIATPEHELLASAGSLPPTRRGFGWSGATRNPPRGRNSTVHTSDANEDGSVVCSTSAIAAAAMQLASAASSFISSTESAISHVNATLSRITNLDRQRMSTSFCPAPPPPPPPILPLTGSAGEAISMEPLDAEVINQLRESLIRNVFRACYRIGRRHYSDQILHRIAELLLSSGEEERYINELFEFVSVHVSDRLGLSASAQSSWFTSSGDLVSSTEYLEGHPIVGLHLTALLFTRCQSLCARLAWSHNLPHLLISWIARSDVMPQKLEPFISSDLSQDLPKDTTTEYYKALLLTCLILDQYDRSITVMHLRQNSTKLYVNCHSWNWFDDRAMLWHPYTSESMRIIDSSFHNGDLSASCQISRRPYVIEFPTMSQINLDSMHRRPVMLSPTPSEDSETTCSAYEQAVLDLDVPPGLSTEQRRLLIIALLDHLESVNKMYDAAKASSTFKSPIPSNCSNAILRLMLRLVFSSYDTAQVMADRDFLHVLLNYPHGRDFSAEYSAFVGSIIIQVFDDSATVSQAMREVFIQMRQFGIPSSFMGINTGANACRDLFYLLSMCAPMFAKDYEGARRLACETFSLSLTDSDVLAKSVPKSLLVDPLQTTPTTTDNMKFTLSDRQKFLLTQLLELVLLPSSDGTYRETDALSQVGNTCAQDSVRPAFSSYADAVAHFPTVPLVNPSSATASTTLRYPGTQEDQPPVFTQTTASTGASTTDNNVVNQVTLLSKGDIIRYLIDLVSSYNPVAEFVALYKRDRYVGESSAPDISDQSLLSHIFHTQLSNPKTADLAASLLENLILVGCESTQENILSELKASLSRVVSCEVTLSNPYSNKLHNDSIQLRRNDQLTAHILFLERLLALPPPIVDHLIHLIYRRHIPADVAKLIAAVDCDLPNTQFTLAVILRTLEKLTWVDRQISKLHHVGHGRRSDQVPVSSHVGEITGSPNVHQDSRLPLLSSDDTGGVHTSPRTGHSVGGSQSTSGRSTSRLPHTNTHLGTSHPSDSDSDDDDDVELLDRRNYRVHDPRTATGRQTDTSNTAALNLVLDDVIMDGSEMLDAPGSEVRDEQSWHAGAGQDGSVIFVHDEEDEGSAGQNSDDNSQDEDVIDDEDDDDGEPDDEDDDNDEEEDDDGREIDEEVIAHDGDVALVLRSGSAGRRLRGSRRPRTEATISVSVTSSRAANEHEATASAGETLRVGFQRSSNDLDIHGDAHEDSDGSFDEDDVDTFGQDDSETDLGLITHTSTVPVLLNTEGSVLREPSSVVSMVEDLLNLVDVPHHANPSVGFRSTGVRRDRLLFAPSEFSGLNVIPSGRSGNWGLFLPRLRSSESGNIHLRTSISNGLPFPPNTTVFRFGPGSSNAASVLVPGGNNNRFGSSAVTALSSNGPNAIGHAQPLLATTLASQHPLLQVPPNISTGSADAITNSSTSILDASSTNPRLSRTVVANTTITPLTARSGSVLPPILPSSSSSIHGPRSRVSGPPLGSVLIGNSGTRSRGLPTRLYAHFTTESAAHHSVSPEVESHTALFPNTTVDISASPRVSDVPRDSRSGPEADALVWHMLSSFAEDQPSTANSALASAVFSLVDPASVQHRATTRSGGRLSASQLAPYAGYALPASYRRWLSLVRMLFGVELMDIILKSRYDVHEELSQRRQSILKQRLSEADKIASLQPAVSLQDVQSVLVASPPTVAPASSEDVINSVVSTSIRNENCSEENLRTSSEPTLINRTVQFSDPSGDEPQNRNPELVPQDLPPEEARPPVSQSDSLVTQTTGIFSGLSTSQNPITTPAVPAVLLTDEETIQSLVEGGMDPSFLDALPEEIQRELIADHRHARQVQQQLSSLPLPEHINAEWLSGLPAHIQEEVLNQFRNEQQQQQQQQQQQPPADAESNVTPVRAPEVAPSATRRTESNADFLISLPTSLRREVLADMEDSQLEILPPDLVAEARQLRRENEDRFARAVQGGMLTHSFSSRQDHDMWRNLTAATGLIGGPGRWDVRFSSINQFLRHLNSTLSGPLGSTGMPGLQNVSGIRGRHLVDYDGLTCLIALLVASSACAQLRRHVMPTLKKVLRNLSCHFATRSWLVGTLVCLFNGLSERAPSMKRADIAAGLNSDTPMVLSDFSKPCASSSSDHSNSVFYIGFEVALGCWVRIFHPITSEFSSVPTESSNVESKLNISSNKHIVHPQAVVPVSIALLETLGELAKAFPVHFYPRSIPEPKTDRESSVSGVGATPIEWPRPLFWELFDRMSEIPPHVGTAASQVRQNRRSHCTGGRKRISSMSNKQSIDSGSVQGSQSQLAVGTPMEVAVSASVVGDQDIPTLGGRFDAPDSTLSARRRPTSASSGGPDYFVHLFDFLCHPLLKDRPLHQERILTILAGIVREFLLSRGHRVSSTPASDCTQSTPQDNSPVSQPAPTGPPIASGSSSLSQNVPETRVIDLIGPLRIDVIKQLCQLVWDSKLTDSGRSMATQLITDLAFANRHIKTLMLQLLLEACEQLMTKLSAQLQDLAAEIDQPKVTKVQQTSPLEQPAFVGPSSSTRTDPFDVIPDRFSDPGQLVVISGNVRSASFSVGSELQLDSVQAFSCPNNNQSRFRGVLGLIVRVAAGESSVNVSDAVPLSTEDPFASLQELKDFWLLLSDVFERLQSLSDPSAVMLLQPLLEAFCIAHLFIVKDSILIRPRSTSNRSGRPKLTGSSDSQSLIDMVPLLQFRVEPLTSTSNTTAARDSSNNEFTTHLHLDVMGPTSPPLHTVEDRKSSVDALQCHSIPGSSANNTIVQFAEKHKSGLNQVLRQNGNSLGESPFAVFLVYPRVLDFDIKRRFFRQQLQSLSPRSSLSSRYDDEPIVISRDRIFEDSYSRLHRKLPNEWKHKFVIRFQNEEGQDAGGPLREWYLLMSREIFNPNYCLFRTSPADRVTYTINPSSYVNSNHLSYFKFVGRFIAKAIYDNKLLECYFSRSFYKHMLGVPVKCSDLESDDYDFYKGLEFLLKNCVSDLGYELTFSTEIDEFGKTETRDLIENGRNVHVTEQNKREYIRLVCQERMTGSIRQQLDAFLNGFYEIIPKRMISIFNEQELELLISGLPSIDIADLKANTTYSKYQPTSPQIEWFWTALESCDQEDRARFLQFVTGTSKVPLGGFANLEGMHGPTKFQISRASASSTSHLPCAHTCFNTLVLPAYESYDQLRSRLLIAIRECSEGYGMA